MSSIPARHARIFEVMRQNPYMTYKDLAEQVGVSAITIRRDIAKLEQTSPLKSAVGGIINAGYLDIDVRLRERTAEKRRIGALAATLIKSGQSIFLDAGSTTYYVLEALKARPQLTTITYDLKHHALLRDLPLADHYIVGGQLHPGTNQMMGPLAEEYLNRFRADVALIGCTSLSAEGTLSCNVSGEVPLKRIMMRRATRTILVTDSSKFSRDALLAFGDVKQVDVVVSEARPPAPIARMLEVRHVKLMVAS